MSIYTVTGMKRFNDTVEGVKYDFTKLRVQFKASSKNADRDLGYGESEIQIGDSTVFDKLKHLAFPCQFELEIEQTNKGPEIVSFKPLAPVTAPKAA
jgi:hypothetical protein